MLSSVLVELGGSEVSAMDVYTDMFRLGEGFIQQSGEEPGQYKANPLVYWKNEGASHGQYRILFEDTFEETIKEAQEADFTLINGITYFGRKNVQQHASKMYAMIFDLDAVDEKTLINLLSGASVGAYPVPNYIILSGSGLHLYYLFEDPIPLFPNIKLQLKELKFALTDKIWNQYTSNEEKPQHQGINQGFKVIGGHTKSGSAEKRVRAFRINQHPFTLSQLCDHVPEEFRIDESKLFRESQYTLEDAKKKFPEWYEKVIVKGDRRPKKWDIAGKVHGDNPYALYDWWLRTLQSGATYGHRYFAIMALAIYAVKNDVSFERLDEDAHSLIPLLNGLNPNEPFTEYDVASALECYDDRYYTFPVKDISKLTAIQIEPNKRNGRKQKEHLRRARAVQNIDYPEGEWRNKDGRPAGSGTKAMTIYNWRQVNPDGRKAECIRETALSKPTVYKWWDWQPVPEPLISSNMIEFTQPDPEGLQKRLEAYQKKLNQLKRSERR